MRLNTIIRKEKTIKKALPLCRTISFSEAEQVLEKGQTTCHEYFFPDWFTPKDNKDSKSYPQYPMTYFFYGYPGYISHFGYGNEQDLTLFHDWPIGIILKDSVYSKVPFSAYPFDTGALLTYRYSNVIDTSPQQLHLYALERLKSNPTKRIGQYIHRYFGSNSNYLKGSPVPIKDPSHSITEINLSKLLRAQSMHFDHRSKLIECHVQAPVALAKHIWAFILPRYNSHSSIDTFQNNYSQAKFLFYNELDVPPSENSAIFACTQIMQIGLRFIQKQL